MRKKCEKSSEKAIIVISCGFITLKLDNINGNSIDLYTDLRKKLFYVHCEKCESNEYQKVKIELENMNGNVICSNCKSEEIRIMWNIKAVFVDH
jgi:Zn finger protein HypA/HybF involved in hydrogenase expression